MMSNFLYESDDEDWYETKHGYQFDSGNGSCTNNKFAQIVKGTSQHKENSNQMIFLK